MKIFNIIMNRKLGGAEQAFLDYYQALTSEGHQIINITSSFAKINDKLRPLIPNRAAFILNAEKDLRKPYSRLMRSFTAFRMTETPLGMISHPIKLPNLFPWCIISKIYLKILILIHKPDLIIAHGGRAVNFSCSLGSHLVPVIGVTHSYSIKHILKCDYIIALDEALKSHLARHGYQESKVFIVPNMVDTNKCHPEFISGSRETTTNLPHEIPSVTLTPRLEMTLIGAMGRFVPEKGFNYLIEAMSILKKKNYNVKLILGGSGPLENELKKLVGDLGLQENVVFVGWVGEKRSPVSIKSHNKKPSLRRDHVEALANKGDEAISSTLPGSPLSPRSLGMTTLTTTIPQNDSKTTFFQSIDIFCIPSTFETFGIVALESMNFGVPTIVANTGGLKTIVENEVDGLVVEAASSQALANAIAKLIDNPKMAKVLKQNAYQKILSTYDINVVKKNLSKILEDLLRGSISKRPD